MCRFRPRQGSKILAPRRPHAGAFLPVSKARDRLSFIKSGGFAAPAALNTVNAPLTG
jgi:hypothetical protein